MKRSKIKIIVDGTIDFIPELKKKDVEVIKLRVFNNNQEVKLSNKEFFKQLKNFNNHFTTSQPSPQEFTKYYNKYKNYQLIVITASKKLSGIYNSAMIAKKESNRDDITVIDSKTTSMGIALLAKAAIDVIKKGGTYEQVIKAVKQQVGKLRIYLVTTTLDYIVRSGRAPKAFGYLAKLIKLKPIVQVKDGLIKSGGKVIFFNDLIDSFSDFIQKKIIKTDKVYIIHNNMPSQAKKLSLKLSTNYKTSIMEYANRALSVHVGPEGIGAGWLEQ